MRKNFTQLFIAGLAPPKAGRLIVHDTRIPGLIVVVTASGVKSFYLYRRIEGKPTRVFLGRFPVVSVDQARDHALKQAVKANDGENPNEEKRARRKSGVTVGEAFTHFTETRVKVRGSARTLETNDSRYNTCLVGWNDRRLNSIKREEVIALHVKIGKERGHVTANRAIHLLKAVFNHANDKMGANVPSPVVRIEMFKETQRERFLRADELPTFFAALEAEPNEDMRDIFALALFTGARRWNVLSMKWEDLNLAAAVWVIPGPSFKTKRIMNVVLSAEALEILTRRKGTTGGVGFVFPSYGKFGHLVAPKKAWDRLRQRSGLKDLKPHDLRRTLGSWQAAAGASLPVIGKSLGHVLASTTQIYARLDLADVRASVDKASAALKLAGNPTAKKD